MLTLLLKETRNDLISKCNLAEPKHGEIWQSVRKDPANAYKTTEEVLRMTAERAR